MRIIQRVIVNRNVVASYSGCKTWFRTCTGLAEIHQRL